MTDTMTTEPATKRVRKMAREPQSEPPAIAIVDPVTSPPTETPQVPSPAEKPNTKAAMVLEMLRRPEGVMLEELVAATGWLPHTTRAALTGLRKKGHVIDKQKADGVTRYKITSVADQ